jgi:hypothetical protein
MGLGGDPVRLGFAKLDKLHSYAIIFSNKKKGKSREI